MGDEAGHEAAGLRGAFLPKSGELLLLRDATLCRDSLPLAQSLVASALKSVLRDGSEGIFPSTIVIVAAYMPPRAHTMTLRRLGAPAHSKTRLVFLDARSPCEDEIGIVRPRESNQDTATSVGDESEVVRELCGHFEGSGTLVYIDSADALLCGIQCDVGILVRAALGRNAGVIVAVDEGPPGRFNVALDDLADVVLEVRPLLSRSTDYNGRIWVEKQAGCWSRRPQSVPNSQTTKDVTGSFLYRLSDTTIRYFR
jgi:hypothetical protein